MEKGSRKGSKVDKGSWGKFRKYIRVAGGSLELEKETKGKSRKWIRIAGGSFESG